MKNKILIIGHARHGKTTLADILNEYGYSFLDSSRAASDIFIYERLKGKYHYSSPEQCFEDRINHRSEWYDLICEYNYHDKARLAKDIMKTSDIYVGMRDNAEIEECLRQGIFDLVIGVYDPRKPLEPPDSFNIDLWSKSDIVIPNSGTLDDLKAKIQKLSWLLEKTAIN
jgi:hypothetical protein